MAAALADPVGLDRTLKPVSPIARQLLRLFDVSRQMRWTVQALADVLPILGHPDGLAPVVELLECGLAFPDVPAGLPVESFAAWIGQAAYDALAIFTVPAVAARCRAEPVDLQLPLADKTKHVAIEADGLEWLLRGSVVWQLVLQGPLRRTQNGGLFKRDQERLRAHAVLATAPADAAAELPDAALLAIELARGVGIVVSRGDEWFAGAIPESWRDGLGPALTELWTALNGIATWDPLRGYEPDLLGRKWRASLSIALALALLETPAGHWHDPDALAEWLAARQPDAAREIADLPAWSRQWLLGVLQSLRIVESVKAPDGWRVRLTTAGRQLLGGGVAKLPAPAVTQTLLVQPNLEVIVYRQGLTPGLLTMLSRFAEWKTLGMAGTLTLTPESVYRGLESGLSLNELQRTLERHSSRPLSESVIELLRSWASKRERVQVYPQAVLLEFRTPADLDAALRQGIIEQKLTDRIGLCSSEKAVEYPRFRLAGSRDYLDPEEACVTVEPDGLTLHVAEGKADLLLQSEIKRFAEQPMDDRPTYVISVETLQRGRDAGVDLRWLDDWFQRRTGAALPPTPRMLLGGPTAGPFAIEPRVIVRVPSAEVGDGLERWSAARAFLGERLGPTSFAVPESHVAGLRQLLTESGLLVAGDDVEPAG